MTRESFINRLQKLESESNRQKFAIQDIERLLTLQCQRIDALENENAGDVS